MPPDTVNLFTRQTFTSHSGLELDWKIDCDALSDEDLATCAYALSEMLRPFHSVHGIATGGTRLAEAFRPYRVGQAEHTSILVVDDVLTSGESMRAQAAFWPNHSVVGAVLFARGPCPSWIMALFRLPWVS